MVPQLLGRERELTEIAAFATGSEGYRRLEGGAFTGKTALLYEAVTVGLPDEVDVVSYFLSRRRSDATSDRFLAAVVPQQGRFATHYMPGGPGGFPGWHTVVGSIFGWAVEPESSKQQWFVDTAPWAELAPAIISGLSREELNGIRLFVGQRRAFEACEIKINGRLHEPPTAALSAPIISRELGRMGAELDALELMRWPMALRGLLSLCSRPGLLVAG